MLQDTPPHFREHAVDKEFDLDKVGRALDEVGDGIVVVGGETVYLQDNPGGRGGHDVFRIGLASCLGTGSFLLGSGGGGGGGGGRRRLGGGLGRRHGIVGGGGRVFVTLAIVVNGVVVRVALYAIGGFLF